MVAVADYENHDGFSDRDKTAIAFAEALTKNPMVVSHSEEPLAIPKELQARLHEQFSEKEILELLIGIAGFNFMNRLNRIIDPDVDVELPPDEVMALLG